MYNAMTAGRSQANRSSAHKSAREAWIDTSLRFSELVALLGRKAEAIASLREALSIAEELLQDQPESRHQARRRLIVVCSALATLQDDDEPAQSTLRLAAPCVLLEQFCAASPASNSDRVLLADCCCMLAPRGPDRPPGRRHGHLDRAAAVVKVNSPRRTPVVAQATSGDWAIVFIGSRRSRTEIDRNGRRHRPFRPGRGAVRKSAPRPAARYGLALQSVNLLSHHRPLAGGYRPGSLTRSSPTARRSPCARP